MPKLKELTVNACNEFREHISVRVTVKVLADGTFTGTVVDEDRETLRRYGYEWIQRSPKEHEFSSNTLVDLEHKIKAVLQEAITRTFVSSEKRIYYNFKGSSTCMVSDKDPFGEVYPNGTWVPGEKNDEYRWQDTDNYTKPFDISSPTVKVVAVVVDVNIYQNKAGKELVDYNLKREASRKDGSNINWLESQIIRSMMDREKIFQWDYVPATEENAKFFVDIIKFIHKTNHLLLSFNTPETILKAVEARTLLQISNIVKPDNDK